METPDTSVSGTDGIKVNGGSVFASSLYMCFGGPDSVNCSKAKLSDSVFNSSDARQKSDH